jgi:hypothetical protein
MGSPAAPFCCLSVTSGSDELDLAGERSDFDGQLLIRQHAEALDLSGQPNLEPQALM